MKILLTGGSGILGSELKRYWHQRHCVLAPCRTELDITNKEHWNAFAQAHPDIECIFHAAAYTGVEKAEREKELCFRTNVVATRYAVATARSLSARLVYISTDYVFDGKKGMYVETDVPSPVNFYALTKLLGEEAALGYDESSVVRTSHAAKTPWKYPKAWADVYTGKDYVDVTAPEIARVANIPFIGIMHIVTERKTVLELAQRRSPRTEPLYRSDVNWNVPQDVSLDCTQWAQTKRMWHQIYRSD